MSRKDEYRAHLRSHEWQGIRETAMESTGGVCAFCGAPATQVHHVRYPKQFADDSVLNAQPVCDECHRKAHGIADLSELAHPVVVRATSAHGQAIDLLVDDGQVFAPIATWLHSMRIPASLHGWFRHCFERNTVLKTSYAAKLHDGTAVYRWQAAARSMLNRHDAYVQAAAAGRNITVDAQAVEDNFQSMMEWLFNESERALAAAHAAARKQSGQEFALVADGPSLLASIDQLYQGQRLIAATVDGQRAELKHQGVELERQAAALDDLRVQVKKDGDHCLTAKAGARELCLDETVQPIRGCGHNWETLIGVELKAMGAAPGPRVAARLSGCSVVTLVNTWRRSDIHRAVESIRARLQTVH